MSQFTLYADSSRGRRPSFAAAAAAQQAENLLGGLVVALEKSGAQVSCGKFGARMLVSLENDGPFTLMLEV